MVDINSTDIFFVACVWWLVQYLLQPGLHSPPCTCLEPLWSGMQNEENSSKYPQSKTSLDLKLFLLSCPCFVIFLSSPPFVQDVNSHWSFYYPKLYTPGQRNMYFNRTSFLLCIMQSCYNSLILFFIPYAALHDTVRQDGREIADYQSFAILLQTCLIIVVNAQVRNSVHIHKVFTLTQESKTPMIIWPDFTPYII